MRYKVTLSYNGSAFCGWQRQNGSPSVQACLEDALGILCGAPTEVVGCGRTDTGVHASKYVAHFDTLDALQDVENFRYKLNAILPKEIAVSAIEKTRDDFHARFDATSREYRYFIHRCKDPFMADRSWYCRYPLDVDRMNEACALLLGRHDFSCFEKTGSSNATSVCEVSFARWEDIGEGRLQFTVRANRFLRNMVRAIVGTMVEVGRGVREPQWVEELIKSGTRGDAGQSVPGHALLLSDVRYPEN